MDSIESTRGGSTKLGYFSVLNSSRGQSSWMIPSYALRLKMPVPTLHWVLAKRKADLQCEVEHCE